MPNQSFLSLSQSLLSLSLLSPLTAMSDSPPRAARPVESSRTCLMSDQSPVVSLFGWGSWRCARPFVALATRKRCTSPPTARIIRLLARLTRSTALANAERCPQEPTPSRKVHRTAVAGRLGSKWGRLYRGAQKLEVRRPGCYFHTNQITGT